MKFNSKDEFRRCQSRGTLPISFNIRQTLKNRPDNLPGEVFIPEILACKEPDLRVSQRLSLAG